MANQGRPRSRTERSSSGGFRLDLRIVGVVGFLIGITFHACIVMSVLDDGSATSGSSNGGNDTPGITIETAPTSPPATPTPVVLPDRTDCEEIRGTQYRSESEREFFLGNCL